MKLFKNFLFIMNIILLFCIVIACVLSPLIAPYEFNKMNLDDIWKEPCQKYVLGADKLGRDIFSRLLYGGRVSLFIAFIVEVIAFPIGSILGYISATKKSFLILILNRIIDVLFSFPTIINGYNWSRIKFNNYSNCFC